MLPFLCSPDIPIGSSTQLSLLPYTEMPIEADRMKKLHIKKKIHPSGTTLLFSVFQLFTRIRKTKLQENKFPSLVEIQKYVSQHHCGSNLSFQLEEQNCGHLFSVTTREFRKTVKIKLCLFKDRQLTW